MQPRIIEVAQISNSFIEEMTEYGMILIRYMLFIALLGLAILCILWCIVGICMLALAIDRKIQKYLIKKRSMKVCQ